MSFFKTKRRKRVFVTLAVTFSLLLALLIASAIYLSDYYEADEDKIAAFSSSIDGQYDDGKIIFEPLSETDTALVFYPGGKVHYRAYIPLMQACAEEGILCILYDMPFNLAVFDSDAADGIQNQFPKIKNWYIGGHSLGGSMAASFLADTKDSYSGLVLLGSYSTEDFSDSQIKVLSVYGSCDKVLDMADYNENKANLPSDFEEVVIDGGCHAFFGMYGRQDGDGEPSVTNEEQIYMTADAIASFVGK